MDDTPAQVQRDGSDMGLFYLANRPLMSSYGTQMSRLSMWLGIVCSEPFSKVACLGLQHKLNHEECNFRTINTRPVFGPNPDLDLPLYEYAPLLESGWIRLLHFSIQYSGDDIQTQECAFECEMYAHKLEDAKKVGYKALSYAWGEPNREHYLPCNGSRIPITKNLAEWFHHCDEGDHLYWIDAVCINQMDTTERTCQVGNIRDVYRNAQGIIAWLGGVWNPRLDAQSKFQYDVGEALDDFRALAAYDALQQDFSLDMEGPYGYQLHGGIKRVGLRNFIRRTFASLRVKFEKAIGLIWMLHRAAILRLTWRP